MCRQRIVKSNQNPKGSHSSTGSGQLHCFDVLSRNLTQYQRVATVQRMPLLVLLPVLRRWCRRAPSMAVHLIAMGLLYAGPAGAQDELEASTEPDAVARVLVADPEVATKVASPVGKSGVVTQLAEANIDIPAAPSTRRIWYGYQPLISDGISIALIALSADNIDPLILGALSYTFAPGVIHLLHDDGGKALGSIGLRLGLPILGGLLVPRGSSEEEYPSATDVVFSVAILTAMVVDSSVLSFESVPVPTQAVGNFSLQPLILNYQGETVYGVGGTF